MKGNNLHLFFVVESKSQCGSDWQYIESVILHFYEPRTHSHKPIFVEGKGNLTNERKINKAIESALGEIHVIICADKDTDDDDRNNKIAQLCEDNGYDLVWMNINIEDVFLDDPNVEKRDKGKRALPF